MILEMDFCPVVPTSHCREKVEASNQERTDTDGRTDAKQAETHSEVHEVEEFFQHFRHNGEISFRQVLSHSSHIHLVERHKEAA